jgi:DnaJ family protein C protein 7
LGSRQYFCKVGAQKENYEITKLINLLFTSDTLRLNPNSPDALTLRGLVLFLGGRLPQALQHLTSALRFDPGHEPAMKLRRRIKDIDKLKEDGNTAFKAGNLQDAVDKYSECLEVRTLQL